jgi:hypothetical protein
MKISKDTLKILKNYQKINPSLIIKSGNTIKTLSDAKNVYAIAHVEETFPDFAIYDLNKLLSVVEIVDDPDIIFYDTHLTISNERQSTRYLFSDITVLTVKLPEKDIIMTDIEAEFMLRNNDITTINQFSTKLSLPDLVVKIVDDVLVGVVCDKSNSATNNHTIKLEQSNYYPEVIGDTDIEFNFKIANLKLLSGDYWISISKKKISKFCNENMDLIYWIACESDSIT